MKFIGSYPKVAIYFYAMSILYYVFKNIVWRLHVVKKIKEAGIIINFYAYFIFKEGKKILKKLFYMIIVFTVCKFFVTLLQHF